MISIFGSTLGFMSPGVLWLFPLLLGGLFYVYRRKGRAPRVAVASVMLLRALKRSVVARQKFVPPLRFFFELLLLSLLLLAAAGLFRKGAENHIAILIDNSLSMGTLDFATRQGDSFFKTALDDARRTVRYLSSSTLIDLYVTSPQLRRLGEGNLGSSAALAELDAIELAYAADNLQSALQTLSNDSHYESIEVLTDHLLRGSSDAAVDAQKDARFRFPLVRPKNKDLAFQNVAISSVSGRATSADQGAGVIRAAVSAFVLKEADVTLTLEGLRTDSNGWKTLPLDQKKARIRGGDTVTLQFEHVPFSYQGFKLRLQPDRDAATLDAIKEDNEAWFALGTSHTSLAVISDFPPQKLGLDKIRTAKFRQASLAEGAALLSEQSNDAALIFHRTVPSRLPDKSTLFILPPSGNGLFPAAPLVPSSSVTRWSSAHPIISYLNLPGLQLKSFSPLTLLPWTEELVSTTNGAAIIAGEYHGKRYAVIGFELFPYEGKNTPLLSILTLNLLKWLTDAGVGGDSIDANSVVPLDAGVREVRYVNGEELPLIKRGTATAVNVPRPGLVQIQGSSTDTSFRSINFSNGTESNSLQVNTFMIPARPPKAEETNESQGLVHLLCTGVFFLLLADLLILLRLVRLPTRLTGVRNG